MTHDEKIKTHFPADKKCQVEFKDGGSCRSIAVVENKLTGDRYCGSHLFLFDISTNEEEWKAVE